MAESFAERPDEVLVVLSILGDLDAFDELASRYRAAAVRVAEIVAGREDAEDIAQESLLLAFKALPSLEEPSKFAAWLSAITRHRALRFSHRERAARRGRVELDDLLLSRVGAFTRPLVDRSAADEELRLALERVPTDYSLALRLRFIDEMPLKRIAAFLGVPVSTIKWRLHKGKQLLREQLDHLRRGEKKWKEKKR